MKRPHFFKKIQVQVSMNALAAGLLAVLLVGFILYYSMSHIVLQQSIKSTEMAIGKSGDYIDLYIERLKAITKMIAEDSRTIFYLEGKRDTALCSQNDMMDMIRTTINTDPYIKSIIIVGKNGEVISNEEALSMTMSSDMMNEEWYVEAIHSGSMPHLTSARMQKFSMDKEEWVISMSREITNNEGENIGVMVLDVHYKVIEDYLDSLDLGSKGCAFILNDSGQVVYHKNPAYFSDPVLKEELNAIRDMAMGYDAKIERLIEPYPLKHANWTLIGISSLDELAGVKRQLIETVIIVGIIIAVVVIASGTYFAGKITNPIKQLEQAMMDIDDGLKEVHIHKDGTYEVNALALQFNRMIVRIRELMQDVTVKEKNIREYELKVLHSQINPHFLYNTLDTIVWMAEFDDSQKVIAITKALASFFRLSLRGGSERTTVKHEFEHVRMYLFIQKERYGDQLTYDLNYDADIEDCLIPKIILQPIVENAIYHGIRGMDKPGYIEVTGKKVPEGIVFTVMDNGVGFDRQDEEQEDSRGEEKVKLGGVGIQNVDKRIKLYYGKGYGVEVQSEPGVGTTVRLVVGRMIRG